MKHMVEQISFAAEFDAVLSANKSVFVDFFATWCGPCKMVGPVVEKVSETEPDVKFVKIDVDEVGELGPEEPLRPALRRDATTYEQVSKDRTHVELLAQLLGLTCFFW